MRLATGTNSRDVRTHMASMNRTRRNAARELALLRFFTGAAERRQDRDDDTDFDRRCAERDT